MKARIKKAIGNKIVRVEGYGDIKEVIINKDLFHPEQESIALCFRGESSSGIIDLSSKEIEMLYKEMSKKKHLFKDIKVIKFRK